MEPALAALDAELDQESPKTVVTNLPTRGPKLPESLAEYELMGKLGSGGMGTVYKALHVPMNRTVALKVLPEDKLDSPQAVKRFRREIKAAAKLTHPNIVTAYDAGEQSGVHFLVMEFVDGIDLGRLVSRDGPLPMDAALDCVIQAAEGLAHAHDQGVIHRDVKPANLILDAAGVIKILDFGLARIQTPKPTKASSHLTNTGTVLGTPAFMAPEQSRQIKNQPVDHRADVYSFGCTLFHLLTGAPPFGSGSFLDVIVAHRDQPIPKLRDCRQDASPDLDSVLQRMLAKNPKDRFPTMREALRELQVLRDALNDDPVDSLSPSLKAFFQELDESGLASEKETLSWLRGTPQAEWPRDAKEAAQALEREHLLTPYQAVTLRSRPPASLAFGDYCILDEIARRGAFATYSARGREDQALAVLKVYALREDAQGLLDRMRSGCEQRQAVRHPRLAQSLGFGSVGSAIYFVSEKIEGQNLANEIRHGGPYPWNIAVEFIRQTADALAAIHASGSVHGFLQPSQLVLDQDDSVRLTDFPWSCFRRELARSEGSIRRSFVAAVGSGLALEFTAPEAALAGCEIDPRSDTYSLGCVLYYLATGVPPFSGNTRETILRAHHSESPPVILDYVTDAPPALQALFAKAVAKNPNQRYPDARAMLRDLGA
ncbi:MAG: serine/threonine protein kinase, partial [Planctomycetales bacterium]